MSVDPSTVVINGATYQLAIERGGRYAHDIVSGQDLRWEHDFRSGSMGMGETVQQTPTGYLFTDNMDLTKRGMRLSPTRTDVSVAALTASNDRPPFFFEQLDGTSGTSTASNSTTLTDSGAAWATNQWAGATITAGSSTGTVASNTGTVITLTGAGWAGGTPTSPVAYSIASGAKYVYVYGNASATTVAAYKIKVSDNSVTTSKTDPASSTNVSAAGPGRPELWEGEWYTCASLSGSAKVDCIEQLTYCGVSNGGANDTWTAIDTAGANDILLRVDPASGTARMLRSKDGNEISMVSAGASGDGALDEANWAPTSGYQVGDLSGNNGIVTGGASHAGVIIIAKRDGAFAFDVSGNSYSVIPFVQRGILESRNGWGTFSYGNLTYYNERGGLWEITEVNRVRNVAIDSIPYYTNATNITEPIRFHHLEGTFFGEWRYFIYADTTNNNNSYILAMQKGSHTKTGLPIWHTLVQRSVLIRGLFIDSNRKLWWGEPGNNRVCHIQLADDGSPDGTTRGNTSSTYEWYGPELDATHFGMDIPEVTLQYRYAFVEMEGGTANCSWQVKYYLDGDTVNSLGSAITTASTNINWTIGTTDTGRRLRMRVTATTNGSHSTSTDPKILRLVVYARSPDVVTMILKPDEKNRSLFETAKILRKLKDAGPITIREPETNESHSGYIRNVDKVQYSTDSGLQDGIRVVYQRYTAAA